MTRRGAVGVLSVAGVAGSANQDLPVVGNSWVVVLDGAGRYPGVDNGCTHEVTRVVSWLGTHLRHGLLTTPVRDLRHVLAAAIAATAAEHGLGCDVTNPLTPGATVAILRERDDLVEWLVLGDAAVILQWRDGTVRAIVDDRLEHLTEMPVTDALVRTYEPAYVARWRNQPGGFWVASSQPDAAYQALAGSLAIDAVRRVLVCSDGITRLVDRYGFRWTQLFDCIGPHGDLSRLVNTVRQSELADPDPRRWRGNRHDDATAVLLNFVNDAAGLR